MSSPLESRRYELFRRLDDKLLLEAGEARGFPPLVSREIVAVIDATELLLDQVIERTTLNLDVGGGGFITAHTVPAGERWSLISLNKGATVANSHVEIIIAVANLAHQLTTDATAFQIVDVQGLKLQTGDRMGMIATDNIGDIAVNLDVIFNRELVGLAQ